MPSKEQIAAEQTRSYLGMLDRLRGQRPAPANVVQAILEDEAPDCLFRVLFPATVSWEGRSLHLPGAKEFRLGKFGWAVVNRWVTASGVYLERLGVPGEPAPAPAPVVPGEVSAIERAGFLAGQAVIDQGGTFYAAVQAAEQAADRWCQDHPGEIEESEDEADEQPVQVQQPVRPAQPPKVAQSARRGSRRRG